METRARSLEDGITALRDALSAALARPDGTLDDCCETVTQALGPHGEDDVTLVLARIQPVSADGRCGLPGPPPDGPGRVSASCDYAVYITLR